MISLVQITADNIERFLGHILEIERSAFPTPWSGRAFWSEVNRPISHLWALLEENRLIGYTCFWIQAAEVHLMNLAISPDRRRRGWGRYLLTRLIEKGIAEGADKIWLEVRPSNTGARALYRKGGFREIGRRPGYYTDTHEDAILMSLPLFQRKPDDEALESGFRKTG